MKSLSKSKKSGKNKLEDIFSSGSFSNEDILINAPFTAVKINANLPDKKKLSRGKSVKFHPSTDDVLKISEFKSNIVEEKKSEHTFDTIDLKEMVKPSSTSPSMK